MVPTAVSLSQCLTLSCFHIRLPVLPTACPDDDPGTPPSSALLTFRFDSISLVVGVKSLIQLVSQAPVQLSSRVLKAFTPHGFALVLTQLPDAS